tara:strand:+ start:39 stop:371 length:333 start_codon:yes stop_codon:yes gene_type:complete
MVILVFIHRVMLSYVFARGGLVKVIHAVELLSIARVIGMNSSWGFFLVACGPNLTIKLLSRKVFLPAILVRSLSLVLVTPAKYLLPVVFPLIKILGFCHCEVCPNNFFGI